jgi:hypothetical protein
MVSLEIQGHHTNQACYKSGIMSPEYPSIVGGLKIFITTKLMTRATDDNMFAETAD